MAISWYFGANMEFGRHHATTVHAEQSDYPATRLEKGLAAVTVNHTYRLCGHCRQFMNELNSGLDLRIHPLPRAAYVTRLSA